MPRTDVKGLSAALKKNGLSRIYYIFGGDVVGVEKATKQVIKEAVGDDTDLALTRLKGRDLDIPAFYDLMQMAPMLSEYNCILINDYDCEKPYEDMRGRSAETVNNALIAALKEIPDYTVVIFNVTGFEVKTRLDRKTGVNTITDKNKKLADFAFKNGTLCESALKNANELSKIIASKVSSRGGMISIDNARHLAEMCLCDELAIYNEIDKLCAYCGSREISREVLEELVHAQDDTTVYQLANAVAAMDAKTAFDAVEKLNISSDNRGAALYAITGAFLDLYRGACAARAGVPANTAASDFGYPPNRAFVMTNSMRSASRIGTERLRICLSILRDTSVKLNSSHADPRIAIEQAITEMLTVKVRRR